VLVTGTKVEASVAIELLEKKGLSLDAITTRKRGGIGVAYDIFGKGDSVIDLGVYGTQEYGAKFAPKFGVGLSIRF
jgi:hypothetical protein